MPRKFRGIYLFAYADILHTRLLPLSGKEGTLDQQIQSKRPHQPREDTVTQNRDMNLFRQVNDAVATLLRHYRHGTYRIIIDPEGKVSLWAIEGAPNAPFSLSFTYKGRVYNTLAEVPAPALLSFVEYVRKTVR